MPDHTIISVDRGANDPDAAVVVATARDGVLHIEQVATLEEIRAWVLSVAERVKPVFDAMRAELEAMCSAMRPVIQLLAELHERYPDPADWVIEPEPESCIHLCGRAGDHECLGEAEGTSRMCAPCTEAAVAAERVRHAGAPPLDDESLIASLNWGQPLTSRDADWPSDGSGTCAHLCGGGHDCDVRATTSLTYDLPSGGTRTMPMCAACKAAELAEAPRV